MDTCPDRSCLQSLLAGELSQKEQEETVRHVETCVACQQTLDCLTSASRSWENLVPHLGKQQQEPAPVLKNVIAQSKVGTATDHTDAEDKSTPHREASPSEETQADQRPGPRDDDLAFLSPPTKPGSIGRLAHYEILAIIGKGGFGTVLKAFDEKLHRMVAIKALSPELSASGTARQRFIREARAAAAVTHEHLVTIHAVEEDHRPPYLVMQLIDGVTLQQKIDKAGTLQLKEILRIGLQMASGLAAAHKQGLVHRDIKPTNILLENGVERVKITDFGLARAVDDASVTQSGTVAGTPMYMSPEQAEGLPLDHRSDLFSLGTVLYVMCTGRPPFRATGTMAVLKRVTEDTPRPIRETNPEIPEWLADIISKLHAKKPEDRFQTAKEVAELLGQHLAHVQNPGTVPPPVASPTPAATESVGIAVLALTFIAGCGVALGFAGFGYVAMNSWLFGLNYPQSLLAIAAELCVGGIGLMLLARKVRRVRGWATSWFMLAVFFAGIGIFSGLQPAALTVVADPGIEITLTNEGSGSVQNVASGDHRVTAGSYRVDFRFDERNHTLAISLVCTKTYPEGAIRNGMHIQLDPEERATLIVHAVLRAANGPGDKPGWVQLFNGKDLTGWNVGEPLLWKVDNGELVGAGKGTSIATQKDDYAEFRFRAEVKLEGDSDVIIAFRNRPDEIILNRVGNTYGVCHQSAQGLTVNQQGLAEAPGSWIRLEFIAEMGRIEVSLNGHALIAKDLFLPIDPKRGGPIVLKFPATGSAVRLRNIEIMELPNASPPENTVAFSHGQAIVGWGEIMDPNRDCKFISNKKELTITVPGGHHNLNPAAPFNNVAAPRILRKASGDFDVQVEVPVFNFPKPKTAFASNLTSFVAAGLLLWADDQNFVRFELAANGDSGQMFANLHGFTMGKTAIGEVKILPHLTTFLKVERRTGTLRFLHSGDGLKWMNIDIPINSQKFDTPEVEVGVVAVNVTTGTHVATFRGLEIKGLPSAEPGWAPLFNGKDLTGWKSVYDKTKYAAAPWDIVEPVLVLKGGKDQPTGYLRTERQYSLFHLRFDFKHTPFAPQQTQKNSGVLWGVQGKDEPSIESQATGGIELALNKLLQPGGTVYFLKGINEGLPWSTVRDKEASEAKWQRGELISKAGELELRINGVSKIIKDYQPVLGHIALLSRQQGLHFRNIEIKELPPSSNLLEVRRFKGHVGNTVVACSPDGEVLYTASGERTAVGTIRVNDLKGDKPPQEWKGHTKGVTCLALSPDGSQLASCGTDECVRIWDTRTGTSTVLADGLGAWAWSASFSPNGKTLAVGLGKQTGSLIGPNLQLYDLTTGKKVREFSVPSVRNLAISPTNGNVVALAYGWAGQMSAELKDLTSGNGFKLAGHADGTKALAFVPHGELVITGGFDRQAAMWDLAGTRIDVFKGHTMPVESVACSSDGKLLLTTADRWNEPKGTTEYFVWDLETRKLVFQSNQTNGCYNAVFIPRTRTIVAGTRTGEAVLWRIPDSLAVTEKN